jgi:hypothetical protein
MSTPEQDNALSEMIETCEGMGGEEQLVMWLTELKRHRERSRMLVRSDTPEYLPCDVWLVPGLRLGKGVPVMMLLSALTRRAERIKERAGFTPEEKAIQDAADAQFRALLPAGGYPPVVDELSCALRRMVVMHDLMMAKTDIGSSFYDAHCLHEMSAAPLQARKVLSGLLLTTCSVKEHTDGKSL